VTWRCFALLYFLFSCGILSVGHLVTRTFNHVFFGPKISHLDAKNCICVTATPCWKMFPACLARCKRKRNFELLCVMSCGKTDISGANVRRHPLSIRLLRRLGYFVTCYIIAALLFWATEWRCTLSETSAKFLKQRSLCTQPVSVRPAVASGPAYIMTRLCQKTVSWRNWSLFNQSLIRQTFCRPLLRRAVAAVRLYRYGGRSANTWLSLYKWSVFLRNIIAVIVNAHFLRHPQSD